MNDLPTTMPAADYRGLGEIVVEERPVPTLGPDQVLVEVAHCGICGTDIHLMLEGRDGADRSKGMNGAA